MTTADPWALLREYATLDDMHFQSAAPHQWMQRTDKMRAALAEHDAQAASTESALRIAAMRERDLQATIDALRAQPATEPDARPCGVICAGKVRDGLECSPGRCAVREAAHRRVQPAAEPLSDGDAIGLWRACCNDPARGSFAAVVVSYARAIEAAGRIGGRSE